jgi:hypothetical protein
MPEPGKDLWLFCQFRHIKATVEWLRRGGMIGINRPLNTQHSGDFLLFFKGPLTLKQ